mmetsp:Transcript_35520/g.102114  ORF Transcript_35520/g.102114 Transcript_35520/m.102114 type:complete len:218 (+) Transcript_35520:970-1623(+)
MATCAEASCRVATGRWATPRWKVASHSVSNPRAIGPLPLSAAPALLSKPTSAETLESVQAASWSRHCSSRAQASLHSASVTTYNCRPSKRNNGPVHSTRAVPSDDDKPLLALKDDGSCRRPRRGSGARASQSAAGAALQDSEGSAVSASHSARAMPSAPAMAGEAPLLGPPWSPSAGMRPKARAVASSALRGDSAAAIDRHDNPTCEAKSRNQTGSS